MCRLVGRILLIVIWIQQICEDLLVRYYLLLYGFSKYVQTCRSDITYCYMDSTNMCRLVGQISILSMWIQQICADFYTQIFLLTYMDSANM